MKTMKTFPKGGVLAARYDVHAVLLPEAPIDAEALGERLKRVMDECGNVNVFVSEGAGVEGIIGEKQRKGEKVEVSVAALGRTLRKDHIYLIGV